MTMTANTTGNEWPRFSADADRAEREDFVPFIHELAAASAAVIREYYLTGLRAESKADASPVTIADRGAEQAMRELIARRYPDHGVLGEEFGETLPDARYRWVLDPIDGTKAFLANCYIFGTLIALLRDGRPIIGAITSPLVGHVLVGTAGETRLGDRVMRVRSCDRIEDALALTTDHREVAKRRDGAAFEQLISRVRLYRGWGDCHGYFQVATGGADLMLDPVLSAWDIMALVPVIEGAGGRITDWRGDDPVGSDSVIASAGSIHAEVVRLLNP
jgi:histidinol phosphatase-like enzyme (inositol monophosphatase family)